MKNRQKRFTEPLAAEKDNIHYIPAALGDTVFVDADVLPFQPKHKDKFLKGLA